MEDSHANLHHPSTFTDQGVRNAKARPRSLLSAVSIQTGEYERNLRSERGNHRQGALAYFGTYSIDEAAKTLKFSFEVSSFSNMNGTTSDRKVTVSADDLERETTGARNGGRRLENSTTRSPRTACTNHLMASKLSVMPRETSFLRIGGGMPSTRFNPAPTVCREQNRRRNLCVCSESHRSSRINPISRVT
jgi:Lipocalin-like domain